MPYLKTKCTNPKAHWDEEDIRISFYNEDDIVCSMPRCKAKLEILETEDQLKEDEIVEYFEMYLEGENYHSLSGTPSQILNILKENKISKNKRKKMLISLCENLIN